MEISQCELQSSPGHHNVDGQACPHLRISYVSNRHTGRRKHRFSSAKRGSEHIFVCNRAMAPRQTTTMPNSVNKKPLLAEVNRCLRPPVCRLLTYEILRCGRAQPSTSWCRGELCCSHWEISMTIFSKLYLSCTYLILMHILRPYFCKKLSY